MIVRRDLLLGAASVAAAGAAYQLKPRKRVSLLGDRKLESIVPMAFGQWAAEDFTNLVKPETVGKLAARLYSEMIQRIYHHEPSGSQIMVLIAYGDTQSDLLQLHRPESCYPAVGFQLLSSVESRIPLTPAVAIPSRRVVAVKGDRQENIVYWTRLGEYLPTGSWDQRDARLRTAMQGYIPDGGLFRFSALGDDRDGAFKLLDGFVADMMKAVSPGGRRGMVGTKITRQLGG